jgi:hypothetical protein
MRTLFEKLVAFLAIPKIWVWISIVVFLSVSLSNCTNYTTADEHFWLPNLGEERVLDYWRELLAGDFEDTQINDKPGVTLAYLSGIAIPLTSHLYDEQKIRIDSKTVQYHPEITKMMHFAYRTPLILFIGFFSLYFFWIIGRITKSDRIAAISVMLTLLSPVLLGLSQIVNPDTAFWVFGSATLLTFIGYAQERKSLYAYLTTLFLGLSLASKYVSVIFFPFFLFILGASYLYFWKQYSEKESLHTIILRDLRIYFFILAGGTTLFALMMPAAIVDPEVLWESTVGFPGMLPVFLATLVVSALLAADAIFFRSAGVIAILRILTPRKRLFEYVVYGILLLAVCFVLYNWMSRNSIIDLSHIPYYAKTKTSFTEDNPYFVRYIMEFVPLVFALTPLTLFFLTFFWMRAFFAETKHRFLGFVLSVFFLIFYAAVVEQGLLVTVRYSIILFPFAIILATIGMLELLEKKHFTKRTFAMSRIFIGGWFLALGIWSLTYFHDSLVVEAQNQFETILGNPLFFLPLGGVFVFIAFLGGWGIMWLLSKANLFIQHTNSLKNITGIRFSVFAFSLFALSGMSLFSAYPHFFLYMNDLLPKRYVLNNSWGYGGYEAAQHLNELPDAENITLWSNDHGVCEFFVGKCIRSQKLDIQTHRVDYLFYAHRGALASKFETVATTVWEYYPDGRSTNYARIQKNDPDAAIEKMKMKEILRETIETLQQKTEE